MKGVLLRLTVTFAVLIAVLIGIGEVGLHRMQVIDEALSDIMARQSTNVQLARRAMMISNENSRIVMEIVLVENRPLVRAMLSTRAANSKEITRLIEQSDRRCESSEERRLLEEVRSTRAAYLESSTKAIGMVVDKQQHDEAEKIVVNELIPALGQYHVSWDRFIRYQQTELDAALDQAQRDYAKAHRVVLLLIGVAVVLVTSIATFATRDTSRELAARLDANIQARKQNAELEESVASRTMDLSEAQKKLTLQAAALDAAANGIVITDWRGTILWVNHAFTAMTGYSREEVLGRNPRLLKSGEQSESFYSELWSTISSGGVWRGELVNRRKDGTTYTEEMTVTPVVHGDDVPSNRKFIAIKQDISERKRAEEALWFKTALLEAQAETGIDGILVVDQNGEIVFANKQFGLQFAIPVELLAEGDDRRVLEYVLSRISGREAFLERVQYLYAHPEEKSRDEIKLNSGRVFDRYSAPLIDAKRRYRGRIWYFRDVTDQKLSEERAQFLAYYDALTGLPNRILLQDRLNKALARARRQHDKVAILFLDLDRFKSVNDSLGHGVGDLLLQEVAKRLQAWVREQDTVARLGGDEFTVMVSDVKSNADAAISAQRVLDTVCRQFVVKGHSVTIGCSIGISIFPDHGEDVQVLIKNADAAMYNAKDSGRNTFQFFTPAMDAEARERLILENCMRSALERGEFFLMYQPQMDIRSGEITGLEALLRWKHPELGTVPPDRFIPIAENSGMIVPIGEWVLRQACAQARKWQDEGLPAAAVAVNVSVVQFRQAGFCELVRRVLRDTGLEPRHLELELTESLLLSNADMTLSVMDELNGMGVTLAIDDFGAGYSSFSYLRQFRVSKFKIDHSFIRDVATNPADAAITSAIITMARNLKLRVIAEGVENEAQLSFLRANHCDEIQGYYCSRPLMADNIPDVLRRKARAAGGV